MMTTANILDPVRPTLDPLVWDNLNDIPVLKAQHKAWFIDTITGILSQHGYGQVPEWLDLYLTGSLTTYQYDANADCDISLFVNTDVFPEWSRAEMIGIMVSELEPLKLPGTDHPVQGYVVAKGIRPADLYKPGLRSAWAIYQDRWIVPPERERVHNVDAEYNGFYVYALEQADKMERLLRYEPDKAIQFWHQIHRRRMADQKMGKGDYSESNIVYKFLANRGLFDQIEQVSGEHIAAEFKDIPHSSDSAIVRHDGTIQTFPGDYTHHEYLHEQGLTPGDVMDYGWIHPEHGYVSLTGNYGKHNSPGAFGQEGNWNFYQDKWGDVFSKTAAIKGLIYPDGTMDYWPVDMYAGTGPHHFEHDQWENSVKSFTIGDSGRPVLFTGAKPGMTDEEAHKIIRSYLPGIDEPIGPTADRLDDVEDEEWGHVFGAGLFPHSEAVEQARAQLGMQLPVRFLPTYKSHLRGGYAGVSHDPATGQDSHLIFFNPQQEPGARNWAAWHELGHALQQERGEALSPTTSVPEDRYRELPKEKDADRVAFENADLDLWSPPDTTQGQTLDGQPSAPLEQEFALVQEGT